MRRSIVTLIVAMVLGATLYLKEDRLSPGRFRIYDESWRSCGYIIEDRFSRGRFNIYDNQWRRKGRIERKGDRWDLEDKE